MWRKLFFITPFVLVLALGGTAQAWKSIDDPNYNLSFEYDFNGDQIYCSHRVSCKSEWDPNYVPLCGVMAWLENDVDWPIVELPCFQSPGGEDCACKDATWVSSDRLNNLTLGQFGSITDANLLVWQTLDPNYDANVIIQPYHEYRVSYDTFKWGSPILKVYLFYGYIADNNSLDPNVNTIVMDEPAGVPEEGNWGTFSLGFLSEVGQPYIGERLGIRFFQTGEGWYWIDNVKVEYKNLAAAHDPIPEDDATEVPKDANLSWSPGLWAKDVNGHDVYFGSTFSEVDNATTASAEFKGNQSPNSFDPTPGANVLTLGDSYYWRIDEVNENYSPGPNEPPIPPDYIWKGEVWSFTVAGRAKNPHPEDGASDVPKNVILRWTRGVESLYHDVYLGTSEADVKSATTGSGEYRTQLNKGTEQYDAEALVSVGEQHFWRIDEVNTITVKGNVWDFTVADYMLVDDFDFYDTPTDLRVVWKDYYTGHAEGVVLVNKDPNYAVDGNSMLLEYWNTVGVLYSEAKRTYSTGQDWSYAGNGVTALEIDWFGDMNSAPDPPMYVKLSDGSTTAQVNPGPNDVTDESQHTWLIPLKDFSGVTLSSITSIILGIGDGAKEGGPPAEEGTLYFDNIKLHPPRCFVEHDSTADFTGDCVVDNYDVNVMATDWLLADGNIPTETRNGTLTGFAGDDTQWITGHIDGALEFGGEGYKVHVTDPRLVGITNMSITAWVKQTVDNDYVAIVISREGACGDDPVELGIYGGAFGGPDGLGYDWSCGTEEWTWDAGLDVPEDGTWTFCAVSVDPTGATLYMRPDGCDLSWARNVEAHEPADSLVTYFDIGSNLEGALDDVRIYAYDLDFNDVNDLAYQVADPNPWPVYHYDFDETSGLVAADSGTPVIRYGPVPSKANLTDPEAKLQRSVNLRDYAIFANDWLGDFKYPQP